MRGALFGDTYKLLEDPSHPPTRFPQRTDFRRRRRHHMHLEDLLPTVTINKTRHKALQRAHLPFQQLGLITSFPGAFPAASQVRGTALLPYRLRFFLCPEMPKITHLLPYYPAQRKCRYRVFYFISGKFVVVFSNACLLAFAPQFTRSEYRVPADPRKGVTTHNSQLTARRCFPGVLRSRL
jgi:hypothetical protein